ncbi:MAG: riboflavin synthase [Candidatus Omnitrophica bacterium]|nr:riboflavin synthase [Candidatus Omnitrophota bacterium]
MFTGIVAEVGKIKSIKRVGSAAQLAVECGTVNKDISLGDSIAVNGVCLSVTGKGRGLIFDIVSNTFKMTNLKRLKTGNVVNLENALKLGETISGHMVSGHVDGERRIKANQKNSDGWVFDVEMLSEDEKHLIMRGSVAIDGVSLTVGEINRGFFRVFLIPHTLNNTIFKNKKKGDYVNVEFDMTAKYAGREALTTKEQERSGRSISKDMLREKGFM